MKKILFIMPFMAISLLASCGGNNPHKDEEYEVTFSVPEREDTILYGDKTQTVKWGEAPTKPKKDPYRVGYKFTGWYKDEKCSQVFDFQKDRIEGTTTLYSGWEEDPKFAVPLCFISNVNDNTLVKEPDFYYKRELNDDWEVGKGEELELDEGDKVYIGSDNNYDPYNYNFALPSGSFNASGNIMSLINRTDFKSLYIVGEDQFRDLFRGSSDNPSCVVDASELLLPATKLGNYCYQGMFMYTLLVKAPKLPATTLADYCYSDMFYDCSNLLEAPELPATTLVEGCYYGMFNGCSNLLEAPELPATTLVEGCYYNMFAGCENLIKAPELPATTLVEGCYYNMFGSCENINYIKVGFDDGTDGWPKADECTWEWLSGVSATGTFVWRGSLDGPSTRGVDTVPEGWTIETY